MPLTRTQPERPAAANRCFRVTELTLATALSELVLLAGPGARLTRKPHWQGYHIAQFLVSAHWQALLQLGPGGGRRVASMGQPGEARLLEVPQAFKFYVSTHRHAVTAGPCSAAS